MEFFFYGIPDECECPSRYQKHGLHPVLLGDVLPLPGTCASDPDKKPTYHILQKLGHGASSTVWLARNYGGGVRYVAVKIGLGKDMATGVSAEDNFLTSLRRPGLQGHNSIIRLYDSFTIEGPNRFHECLVMEVVAPLGDLEVHILAETLRYDQRIQRKIVRGFAHLHKQGIVHGNPHIGNVGLIVPELERIDEETIATYNANPEVVAVVPQDPRVSKKRYPAYIVPAISVALLLKDSKCFPPANIDIRIFDFGRAYHMSYPITDSELPSQVPLAYRPPEQLIYELSRGKAGVPWSMASDVWAIGCTLFHIRRQANDLASKKEDMAIDTILYHALRMGGPPPAEWLQHWDLDAYCEKNNGPRTFDREKYWKEYRNSASYEQEEDAKRDADLFYDLLSRMLRTEPDDRPSTSSLFTHPFIREDGDGVVVEGNGAPKLGNGLKS